MSTPQEQQAAADPKPVKPKPPEDVPFGPDDVCPHCFVAGPGIHCWNGHAP